MKLRDRFDNCIFSKRKVKTFNHISNECMLQEMKELSEIFAFLQENIDTFKSTNMLKKTEEVRKFKEIHFHGTMRAL